MSPCLSPEQINTPNIEEMNCKETLFDVITSIDAYPFSGESNIGDMNIHAKRVSESSLGLSDSDKINVPIKPKSCSVTEKASSAIPGELYEVTVSWQVQHYDESVSKTLETLHKNYNHLILRTYGEGWYFVRCEEFAYDFTYSEKDGLIECELVIQNKNGVQRIF